MTQARRPTRAPSRRQSAGRPAKPRARKDLGQHFLVDSEALRRIAEAAGLRRDDRVLEIGAGTGELTAELVAAGARIAAVELDEALCLRLRQRFAGEARVGVVNANILDFPPESLLMEAGLEPPYVVVANIPYYITAPILRHLLEAKVTPRRLVLTVQREVAEIIAAQPGKFSLLSVAVQFYGTAELLFRLPPSAFRPAPKVESAVVRIDVAALPQIDVENRELFFSVVRAGFRAPRKQLHNAIGQGLWLPTGEAEPLLQEAGIDPLRRAQTLSLDEWRSVYSSYVRRKPDWEGTKTAAGPAGMLQNT